MALYLSPVHGRRHVPSIVFNESKERENDTSDTTSLGERYLIVRQLVELYINAQKRVSAPLN